MNVTQQTIEQMTETVRYSLEQARPFSGYNITIWTREREHIKLRHEDVQGVVHEIDVLQDALDYGYTMDDGQTYTWTKTQYDLGDGRWFWVYHPVGYDINQFVPEGVQPVDQTVKAASLRPMALIGQVTPQSDGTQPDSGGLQSDGKFKTDFRNRLLVPTRFLKEAGIEPGDEVYVVPDPGNHTILLAKNSDALQNGSVTITTQRVERNGDIRLSSKTLKAADLTDNMFVIETSEIGDPNDKIKVVEVKSS